jgi:hypothetical protein
MNDRISAAGVALALILPLALACNGSSDTKNTTGGKDAGADAGPSAQLKFCNALALQGNGNLRLSLEVGDPPVVMTANSGECSTATGSPCKLVPVGMMVPVRLVDDMAEEVASGTVAIKAGEQWMMLATIGNNNLPTVIGGALKAQYTCSTVDPFMIPDGGVMEPPSPDAGAGQ